MNYRAFVDSVKDHANGIRETFSATDDDWFPMCVIEQRNGEQGIVMIDPAAMGSIQMKNLMIDYLRRIATDLDACKIGLILSTWQITLDKDAGEDEQPIPGNFGDDPRRVETLILQIMDAERVEVWRASIERHQDAPPTLSEWEGPILDMEGRFTKLQEVLR